MTGCSLDDGTRVSSTCQNHSRSPYLPYAQHGWATFADSHQTNKGFCTASRCKIPYSFANVTHSCARQDWATFADSQRRNRGFRPAKRCEIPYFFVNFAKSCARLVTRVFIGAGAIGTLLLSAQPGDAQDSNETTGLCARRNLQAGQWITNGPNRMLTIEEFCTAYANETVEQHSQLTHTQSVADDQFWQIFLVAASPEAIAFAQMVEREDVMDYGRTICPMLEEGHTMDEVRAVQMDTELPADFDAAVNVAAIHAYCPEHHRQIGR